MQNLAWILVQNTLLALIPALVAIIARYVRRPALAHVMWVLVLLKLVTPPLWRAPLLPARVAPRAAVVELSASASSEVAGQGSLQPVVQADMQDSTPANVAEPVILAGEPDIYPQVAPRRQLSVSATLVTAWAIGSMGLGFIMLRRIVRFRSLLRGTHPATPAVEQELSRIAERLELGALPVVRFGPAGVSPLIWFLGGKPLLLLPANMFDIVSAPQRESILAHELAHLKRRDHWVRLMEMAITLLLWWHPLVWMARHGLRAAEEEACDAWVVWLTRDNRGYADALLQLLNQSVTPLPANVSGLGQLGSLKRRLVMIMETSPGKMPRRTGWALIALGALLLPLVPVRGQARQPSLQPADAGTPRTAAVPAPEPTADDATSAAVKALLEMAVQSNKQAAEVAATRISGRGGRGGPGGVSAGGGGFSAAQAYGDAAAFGYGGYGSAGYGSSGANTALQAIRMMGAKAVPALKESIGSGDAEVRALAVKVLAEIHAPDRDSLNAVLKALKDPDNKVRGNAAGGLARYGVEAGVVAPALLPVLEDKDPAVKTAAIRTLVSIEADPKLVTPALTKCLKDEDESVRRYAAEAIGQLNIPRKEQPKTDAAKGDELFQRVNDDLNAVLPTATDAWVDIKQINRAVDGDWEAEGKTRNEAAVQQVIANMKASSKFKTNPGNEPKIQSITHQEDGMILFRMKFSYLGSTQPSGRGPQPVLDPTVPPNSADSIEARMAQRRAQQLLTNPGQTSTPTK